VITDINPGGAELALLRLVAATSERCRHAVIVVSSWDPLRPQFEAIGVPVTVIGLARRTPSPLRLVRLAAAVRRSRPDVVQTWMPAADLLGGIAARLTTRAPVVWNLRNSELDPARSHRVTRAVTRLNGRLSRLVPTRIVAVAGKAADAHAELGHDRHRMVVIHNGFATGKHLERADARTRLGLSPASFVVSRLGRYHPDKDHASLLAAWQEVASRRPEAVLALAGQDMDASNIELREMIRARGLEASTVLLGRLDDPTAIYAASDITVSNSLAEGLPNVVGEAMAHAIPAVVTDAGDSAVLVGDSGRVVPCGDTAALTAAIVEFAQMSPDERRSCGEAARARVTTEFSMQAMADRYESLWSEVAHVRD
jgi:glycosyltransferase involved in cell wall biosynthesis